MSSVQEQMKAYIESSPAIMAIATGGVWTRPLKRGDATTIPFTGDSDPTPQAFDDVTGWVKPCIVIGPRLDRGRYFAATGVSGKHMILSPTVAYYAPPTDQQGESLGYLSILTGRLLKGKRVQIAPGEFGHMVIPQEVTGSVEIPEMPNSGVVMIERMEIAAVFDRT